MIRNSLNDQSVINECQRTRDSCAGGRVTFSTDCVCHMNAKLWKFSAAEEDKGDRNQMRFNEALAFMEKDRAAERSVEVVGLFDVDTILCKCRSQVLQ